MRISGRRLKPEEIQEMLALYAKGGHSSVAIGYLYDLEHSTVLYHAKKHGITVRRPEVVKTVKIPKKEVWVPKPRVLIADKYADIFDYQERPSIRSYASYLQEAMKRPVERHYMEGYRET